MNEGQPPGKGERRGISDETTQLGAVPGSIPDRIGQYRIVRCLGEGGMGIVYEAEQETPRRPVALKVIRGGRYVDEHHIRLFQREAQALARLRHPGIAAIYESGRTEDGQHFFGMELVRGETLTRHLQGRAGSNVLSPAEVRYRLVLFGRICDAVFYAHQRGVIHRDLKPTNVIVGAETVTTSPAATGIPDVKVLDFGLARITDTDVAVTTIHTAVGKVQGTIPYMSPEQIRGNPDEIDVRSDCYSLGVILYEMLSGKLPHDVTRLSLAAAARVICDEPQTPLSRVWRGTRRLDADLATIVSKALEKEPARRYQSVMALGEDVQRYMAHQPILARPPGAIYQIRKVIARHRAPFALSATLGILLVAFSITMAVQAGRIARERDRANQEADTARQISEFLTGLFEVSDPFRAKGDPVSAREILDRGAEKIDRELGNQPLVQARLLSTMGSVYFRLGLFEEAAAHVDRALQTRRRLLGEDHLDVDDNLLLAGMIEVGAGRLEQGLAMHRRALEVLERTLGPNHADVGGALLSISEALGRKGDMDGARAALERALPILETAHGAESVDVARCLNNLGSVHLFGGRPAEAASLFERSVRIKEKLDGADSPDVAVGLNNLGYVYTMLGDYARAGPFLERAITIEERTLEPDHPHTANALHSLGELRRLEGRLSDAERHLRRALEIQERNLDSKDPDLALTLHSLAQTLQASGELIAAEEAFKRALQIRQETLGLDHADVAETLKAYAALLRGAGRTGEALRLEERSPSIRE